MQTALVWACLPLIRSGENHLAVKGGRRQGRQKKRWEDNIREWTGLEFAKSKRAVENRKKWRKLVVKSSVVPQRPWQLRDRWWWDNDERPTWQDYPSCRTTLSETSPSHQGPNLVSNHFYLIFRTSGKRMCSLLKVQWNPWRLTFCCALCWSSG